MICFLLTNTDKCLGPLSVWIPSVSLREDSEAQRSSDAAGRGDESGKKKQQQTEEIGTRGWIQGQNGSEDRQKCTSSYIFGAHLDARQSHLLKKKKDQKKNPNQRCTNSQSRFPLPPPTLSSLFITRRPTDKHVCGCTHGLMQAYTAARCWRSNKILVNNLVLSSCSNPHLLSCHIKVSWVTVGVTLAASYGPLIPPKHWTNLKESPQ